MNSKIFSKQFLFTPVEFEKESTDGRRLKNLTQKTLSQANHLDDLCLGGFLSLYKIKKILNVGISKSTHPSFTIQSLGVVCFV